MFNQNDPIVDYIMDKMNSLMLSTGRKFNHNYSPEEQELMDKDLVLVYQERQDLINKLNQQRKYSSIRAFRRNRYRNAVILRLKLVKKVLAKRFDSARYWANFYDRQDR